jgi:hypothetical protein
MKTINDDPPGNASDNKRTHRLLSPDRIYSFGDLLTDGDGEAVDYGELPPLPPAKEFRFNQNRLTLEINSDRQDLSLDLAAIVRKDSPLRFLNREGKETRPPREWWDDNIGAIWDEVHNAAHINFCSRRDRRAMLFQGNPLDFDIYDALRDGATLDWNLGVATWPKKKHLLKSALPLFDITGTGEDESELILDRYLCRGGSWIIPGPTGIGKSSLVLQLSVAWALGRDCFGLEPSGPLSTLIVQAENDSGDLEEMRDGIAAGFELSHDDALLVNEMVSVATVDDVSGPRFFPRLEGLIREWQPDIVVLDPLLSFIGGDLNRQEVTADFLRHRLNPIIHRVNAAVIVLHHTGKPKFENGRAPDSADYAGLGSSELPNWARAIASLTVEGNGFALTLGKRGKRSGVQDPSGNTRIWLRHSANRIFWEPAEPATIASAGKTKTADDLLAHVPTLPGRILKGTLIDKGQSAGISERKARAFLDELIDGGKVFIQREKRQGTNAAQYITRQSQPAQTDETSEPF